MPSLPTVGGDNGTWGTELNEFLSVSLAADGTLASGAVVGSSAGSGNDPALYIREDYTATEAPGTNKNTLLIKANAKGAWSTSHVLYNVQSMVADDSAVNQKTVTGAVNNGSGLIRLTVTGHGYTTGDRIVVDSVGGTTEANGSWRVTVIDPNTLDLQGSAFSNAYTSGGITTNRAGYSAYLALVTPSVDRGGLTGSNVHADDVNGFFLSNNGTKKATDAFYVGTSSGVTGPAWDSLLTTDALHYSGILLNVSNDRILQGSAYGASVTPNISIRRARGDLAGPLRAKNGDLLMRLSGAGGAAASDVAAATFSGATATIDFYANEDYTASAQGSRIVFGTTTIGATTVTERCRITNADGIDFASGTFATYAIRLKNNTNIVGLNNAGAANVNLLKINTSDQLEVGATISIIDAKDIVLATGTGTKIGTATGQKLAFHNSTPVIQHSTTGETVGFTAGGGTTVTDASTFTGNVGATAYRISDIVKALKNKGLMAA